MIKNFEEFINEFYGVDDVPLSLPIKGGFGYDGGGKSNIPTKDNERFYGHISVVGEDNGDIIKLNMRCLTDNPRYITGEISRERFEEILNKYAERISNKRGFYGKVSIYKEGTKVYIKDIKNVYSSEDSCENMMLKALQKNKSIYEYWTGADSAAESADREANHIALELFVNWARENQGKGRVMPASGEDKEVIDGIEFTWSKKEDRYNDPKEWHGWWLEVPKDVWEDRLKGFQCLWDDHHGVAPRTYTKDLIKFEDWNSLFDGLYK